METVVVKRTGDDTAQRMCEGLREEFYVCCEAPETSYFVFKGKE